MPAPEYMHMGHMGYMEHTGHMGMEQHSMAMPQMIDLNPTSASFIPRAYIIDQPYMGLLPLSEGLKRGNIFPNILLPPIK